MGLSAKPTEPPPPYPPPPPFAPLVSTKVDDQIGLLRPYYHDRFAALASSDLVLPDDHPNPSQIKIGPLGQIVKPGPPAGAGKKKGKGKELTTAAAEGEKKAGGGGGTVGRPPGSGAGKKKAKAATAPGLAVIMPPVVFASQ
jgi:transcriptional activator SPT7